MQTRKLKELCTDIISGGTPSTKEEQFWNGSIPWITSADINGRFSVAPKKFITDKAKSKILPPNNILVVTRVGLGKIATNPFPLAFSQDIQGLVLKKGNSLPYLLYALSTQVLKFKNIGRGATIKGVTREDLEKIEIPLPDFRTQQEIAHLFEQADKARQQRNAANALIDQFLQSCFLSLFGDPVKNEKGWEVKKLDTLCTKITDGEHTTPIREERGIKLLSARNIKNGYIDFEAGLDYIGQVEYDRINRRCNPEFDDVLLSCSGTVGRVSTVYITEPFSLVRSVALIKPKKDLIAPKYLEFFLRSDYGQYQIDVRANKSSQANIFTGPIKELDILVPPLYLQQQFAGIVAEAERLRQKQRESERELEQLFQSLLQNYFGKNYESNIK